MVTFCPGIETISNNPSENRDGRVRGRYTIFLDDLELLKQGKSTCRYRVWSLPNLDYFYNMEPRMSKQLAENTWDTLKYVLERGESEEVRRFVCL